MLSRVKVAIAGVGNCASALVQGILYYNSPDRHRMIQRSQRGRSPSLSGSNDNGRYGKQKVKGKDEGKDEGKSINAEGDTDAIADAPGLVAYNLGGIKPSDIEFVAAFDV